MATKIAIANGNFTTAGTWGDVATASSSLLDAENGSTTLTTSFVESSAITPGAVTIDGIAVKVSGRATSPVGTVSIRLAAAGVLVVGTDVTINVSDIQRPNALGSDLGNGWYFFKFAAPVLLIVATAYTVSLKSSNASQVACFRDTTGGNWSRMLRTTTTGAPGAGDNWFILGEWTAAATKTNRAVTMDQTATTDYGGASTSIASFGIGVGGTLTWGTTAATAYILRLSGILIVYVGGTMTMGTVALPCPRDGSQELQWDCAADGDFGFIYWGTCPKQGLSRTVGKNVVQCLMTVDKAIAATVISVDTDTGFLNGDTVAIAATSTTPTDAETGVLTGAAGASSFTLTAGLTAAHSGTSPNQAEVILLTRNVRMVAVTTTAVWYGQIQTGAVCDWDWVDFRYLGTAVATKNGITLLGTPTTFTADFCGLRDGEHSGIIAGTGSGGAFALTDCTFYNIGVGSGSFDVIRLDGTSTAAVTMTRCTCIFDSNTSSTYAFLDVTAAGCTGFTFDSCRVSSGSGKGVDVTADLGYAIPKIIRSSIFHCLGVTATAGAIHIAPNVGLFGLLIDSCQIRRCAVNSGSSGAMQLQNVTDALINNCSIIASGNGVSLFTSNFNIRFTNCTFAGDASFTQLQGLLFAQGTSRFVGIRCENCTFGAGTAHTTCDIGQVSASARYMDLTLVNCPLQSATEFGSGFTTAANYVGRSFIAQHRKDGTTNTHQKLFIALGTLAYDTATVHSAGASEKLTPTIGVLTTAWNTFRLRSEPVRFPVASGKKITFSVWVQKDVTFNGLAPRLVLLGNPAIGTDDDLVLDTLTVGTATWEQLTGQMTIAAEENGFVQAVVECDGTAGNIYVDDWSASTT